MEGESNIIHCYCCTTECDSDMLTCQKCLKLFHPQCIKSGRPSPLVGDIYFRFTCEMCSSDGIEVVKRVKLQWIMVIMLALYNLQMQGGGKCGFFRWREHICRFIDKNWAIIFGENRTKSATWHGTIAGALSTGANRFFMSGVEVLGETGWWSLKDSKLPSLSEIESITLNYKSKAKKQPEMEGNPIIEGARRKNSNVVEAAVALKEKMSDISSDFLCSKQKKKKKEPKPKSLSKNLHFPLNHKLKLVVTQPDLEPTNSRGIPKIIIKSEKSCEDEESSEYWKRENAEFGLDMPEVPDMFESLDTPDPLSSFFGDMFSDTSCDQVIVKQEPDLKCESEEESSNSGKTIESSKKSQHPDISRKRKAVTKEESPVKEDVTFDSKYALMTPYEEDQLLQKLQNYPTAMASRPDLRRLYRKLVVRKLKREHKIPIFDIDVEVRSFRGMEPSECNERQVVNNVPISTNSKTILDRYQVQSATHPKSQKRTSFITRLLGLEEEQQECITSPYTERKLKPFIFRDYKNKPPKLKLLEEMLIKVNKNNPNWVPPCSHSIDYCYVRAQHIPGVNALCQEFFWSGIDMSESLQYPDFSCVALYRKVIVGFAFMVPDVKYNEAYISFIFCHPEWRRAGISTFMLYHLIQTCMGKDVTLHVSATSSAVFLYQKFGFKVEEFIYDFYDKYLPPDSKECRHALFLRLSR